MRSLLTLLISSLSTAGSFVGVLGVVCVKSFVTQGQEPVCLGGQNYLGPGHPASKTIALEGIVTIDDTTFS